MSIKNINHKTKNRLFSAIIFSVICALIITFGIYITSQSSVDKEKKASADVIYHDNRFAIGGSPTVSQYLNFRWYYNWGNTARNNEYGLAEGRGQKTFLVVGKLDDIDNPHRSEPEYYQFINNIPDHDSINLNRVRDNAQAHPGAYWAIGNEPDLNPFMLPSAYAKWFRGFENNIRQYDPNAKISIGGLYYAYYPFTENAANICPCPDVQNCPQWRYCAMMEDSIQGFNGTTYSAPDLLNTSSPQIVKNNAWFYLFREFYKVSDPNGRYPRIDWWNIHVYPQNFAPGVELSTYLSQAQRGIDNFRSFIDTTNEPNKPLFVTEFAILWQPCQDFSNLNPTATQFQHCSAAFDNNPLQKDFMNSMVQYFTSTRKAQRWFWFYGGHSSLFPHMNNKDATHDIFTDSGTTNLTPLGTYYASLATSGSQFADTIPPSIQGVNINAVNATTINIAFTADDGISTNPKNSGAIEYWFGANSMPIVDFTTVPNIANWKSVARFADNIEYTLTLDSVPSGDYYLNYFVEDAAGNRTLIQNSLISNGPSPSPSISPTQSPTNSPTLSPTGSPSQSPTNSPTLSPTGSPSQSPTNSPTLSPTGSPSQSPTNSPTLSPTTTPAPTPTSCGNMDGTNDSKIDIMDFPGFKNVYNHECTSEIINPSPCGKRDSNYDNRIDIMDFVIFIEKYKETSCQ